MTNEFSYAYFAAQPVWAQALVIVVLAMCLIRIAIAARYVFKKERS